jgi:hypothetical protein
MATVEECNATKDQLLIDREIKVTEFDNLKLNGTPSIETYQALSNLKLDIDLNFTQKINQCDLKIRELTITEEEITARTFDFQTRIAAMTAF